MDWGLLRGTKGGLQTFLRDRIKYPPYLYWFSAVTNLILRFAWISSMISKSTWLQLFGPKYGTIFNDYQLLFFIQAMGEAYRRAQWSLFRVENENINNYEKYRTIHEIPKLIELQDEQGDDYQGN